MSNEPTQEQLDWRGDFYVHDCEVKAFTPDIADEGLKKAYLGAGVELTHKPSGMSVITQGSMEKHVNYERAVKALKQRVESREK